MLEHGARADEVDILFRKRVSTQIFNERAQPTSPPPQPVRFRNELALQFQTRFRKSFPIG